MSNTTSSLKDRLTAELEIKNHALRELSLKDLLFIPLSYSKVCKDTLGDILESYIDKFLERLEKESMVIELYKSPDKSREIIELFREHEFQLDDEKIKALARLSFEGYKNYVSPMTGEIDWIKLVQFNSGNYDPSKPFPNL